jgi:hypothetical protein
MVTLIWEGETELRYNPTTGEMVWWTPNSATLGGIPVPSSMRDEYLRMYHTNDKDGNA